MEGSPSAGILRLLTESKHFIKKWGLLETRPKYSLADEEILFNTVKTAEAASFSSSPTMAEQTRAPD